MEFKTLVFKGKSKYRSRYAILMPWATGEEIGDSSTPKLMPMTATMEGLVKLYPNIDFSGVDLITVKLIEDKK